MSSIAHILSSASYSILTVISSVVLFHFLGFSFPTFLSVSPNFPSKISTSWLNFSFMFWFSYPGFELITTLCSSSFYHLWSHCLSRLLIFIWYFAYFPVCPAFLSSDVHVVLVKWGQRFLDELHFSAHILRAVADLIQISPHGLGRFSFSLKNPWTG